MIPQFVPIDTVSPLTDLSHQFERGGDFVAYGAGGVGCLSKADIAEHRPGGVLPAPLIMRTYQGVQVLTPENVITDQYVAPDHRISMHDLVLEFGIRPGGQFGWRRLPRLGTQLYVSSWGRVLTRHKFARLAASVPARLDSAEPFKPTEAVPYYIAHSGATSTTTASLVFATWWQGDILQLAAQVARTLGGRTQFAFPGQSEWIGARFDANSANMTAHNMVPWLKGAPIPATGVDCRYVLQYARENRRAWAYILLAVVDNMGSLEEIAPGFKAFDLARRLGITEDMPYGSDGRMMLKALLDNLPQSNLWELSQEFVHECPALPFVFDGVVLTNKMVPGTQLEYPARGPGRNAALSFAPLTEDTGAPIQVFARSWLPDVIKAMEEPEAVAMAARNPLGIVPTRGRKPGFSPKASLKAAPEVQAPVQAPQAVVQAPKLSQEQLTYLEHPQVRPLVDLIRLVQDHRVEIDERFPLPRA